MLAVEKTRNEQPAQPAQLTAENPRIVPSFPGSPTIREPFGNCNDSSLSPSPFRFTPSRRASPAVFRRNSPLCRALGLCSTAFTAVTVDLPHCRVQFRIPRLAPLLSTRSCHASGSNPSRTAAGAAPAARPRLPETSSNS